MQSEAGGWGGARQYKCEWRQRTCTESKTTRGNTEWRQQESPNQEDAEGGHTPSTVRVSARGGGATAALRRQQRRAGA